MLPIIHEPRATISQALRYVLSQPVSRPDDVAYYVIELWRLCTKVGYDPTVLLAQAMYETRVSGVPFSSRAWFELLNPAGIGVTNGGLQSHLVTDNPLVSARAHVVHMGGYVEGPNGRWLSDTIYKDLDPRWRALDQSGMMGSVTYVSDLGSGRWATQASSIYATNILMFMDILQRA